MDLHPNAAVVARALQAAAEGDMDTVVALIREDFTNSNDVGAGPWRETRGRDEFLGFFASFSALFDGTFRQDVLDVLGYDDHVVAIVHETGTAQGQPFDNRAIYLFGVAGGQLTSLRTMDMDREGIDRFWSAVSVPAGAVAG